MPSDNSNPDDSGTGDTTNSVIDRSVIQEKLREADSELDGAALTGDDDQVMYWLGRKEALKDLLDRSVDTDNER